MKTKSTRWLCYLVTATGAIVFFNIALRAMSYGKSSFFTKIDTDFFTASFAVSTAISAITYGIIHRDRLFAFLLATFMCAIAYAALTT